MTGQQGQSMTGRHPATLGEDDVAATVARASGGEAEDVAKLAAADALTGRFNHRDFRILGFAASLRRASFHRGIVRAAHEVATEWMSCEGFDLARIPYFNQDIEDQGHPEPVKELREKVGTYDAVLIATPEYDYAIPGVLTAALDWCLRSRHNPTPFRHKPVGIVGASPGGGGRARGQMVLRQILLHPPAYVVPEPQILIPFSRQKFDPETGDLVDEETRQRLRRFL